MFTYLKVDLFAYLSYSFVRPNILMALWMWAWVNLSGMALYVLSLVFMLLLLSLLELFGVFHSRTFLYAFVIYDYNENPQDILYLPLFSYYLTCTLNSG